MDEAAKVEALTELAERLGFEVRVISISGPGGAAVVRGRRTVFLGATAPSVEHIDVLCEALADEDLENVYVLPELRLVLERYSRRRGR